MFAVPGWSVSSDTLRTESAAPTKDAQATTKSRKRKRGNASATENVTSSNVADLYQSMVEGKESKPGKKSPRPSQTNFQQTQEQNAGQESVKGQESKRKRQKKDKEDKQRSLGEESSGNGPKNEHGTGNEQTKKKKAKDKKQNPSQKNVQGLGTAPEQENKAASSQAPASLPPAPPKLTPLQASMREKLISARFRHLNETLYTKPSAEAFQLFKDSPEMFGEYHEGFRRQVKVWPENPVDSFLKDIRARSKVRPPMRGKSGSHPLPLSKTALPRTTGICTIADLGCGDAQLAESIQAEKSKLRLEVKSYDLQSPSAFVTKADIANLPLDDGSVNVAIFCLALMGTNWLDFIEEAYRILHWKGELWVAEIKSRFGPVRSKNAPVNHSVGNRQKTGKKGAKTREAEDEGANENDLAVEIDGVEDRRRETDVSAFVEALKARGFVPQGDRGEAVDLSNKMFVKMHFIKGASPTKGKDAKPQDKAPRGKKPYAPKWDDDTADTNDGPKEALILKPCVYKIR